jgi:DNA-directed RNA polymerase specialized sigma24 family protein
LRAFRAIRGFAGGSARAWVLSVVRNTAYSWLRKNRPAAVVTVDDLEGVELAQANPGDPDAPTPLNRKVSRVHVVAAITRRRGRV